MHVLAFFVRRRPHREVFEPEIIKREAKKSIHQMIGETVSRTEFLDSINLQKRIDGENLGQEAVAEVVRMKETREIKKVITVQPDTDTQIQVTMKTSNLKRLDTNTKYNSI